MNHVDQDTCCCQAFQAGRTYLEREARQAQAVYPSLRVLRLECLPVPEWRANAAGRYDLIYSAELLTGLRPLPARQVIAAATAMLKPGGRLLAANISEQAGVGQCPRCSTMRNTYRSEQDMAQLALDVPQAEITGQIVYEDDTKSNVYLELYRAPQTIGHC